MLKSMVHVTIISIFILMGFIIFIRYKKKTKNKYRTSIESSLLNEGNKLTSNEKINVKEYFNKKYHYYKWKLFNDYQLYHFTEVRLDPESKKAIPKVQIHEIGTGIKDETYFKPDALKECLKQIIKYYQPSLKIPSEKDISEYILLTEKAIAFKAHKEVLEFFKPFIRQNNKELDIWKRLIESEPETHLYQ